MKKTGIKAETQTKVTNSVVYFLLGLWLALFTSCSTALTGNTTINDQNLPRPLWISQSPLVFIGNWDAMPIFRRRVGGNPVWQEENYQKEHTEEGVKKFKDMGVTMAILHFYKGFGLEAEKEHIEDAKRMAFLCKENSLKVGAYIGSTIGFETFLLEKPQAKEWFVPDYLGLPVRYGNQSFRKRVYFMHPGFIEYMKKVVLVAIRDLKVDLIQFDNTSIRAQPAIFHHPLAVINFKTYLKNKYTAEIMKKRFGFSDVRFLEPPATDAPMSIINDPLLQEWMEFRCQQLADFYGIMADYIRRINPEVAIINNPHRGLSGRNTMWEQGVDYPRLLSHTDGMWTEEGNAATVDKNGILVSKIRTYKMARTLNNRIFTYTSDSKLEMAEAMAYNRQGMGMVGGLEEMEGGRMNEEYELPEEQKKYISFFHRNFEYYRGVVNVADVAVLHSYASMAYNNDRPYQSSYLFEQVLIQSKIPFDIIFDNQLKDLSRYKVLVLADQECLNDEKLDLIRAFVAKGGGLIATEHTALYTEWHERKKDFGLRELSEVKAPEWHGRNSPEDILAIPIQKVNVDKGRIVYIPEIIPSIPKPPSVPMSSQFWKLPVNWKELVASVEWAAADNLSINIEAPPTVTMELNEKEDKSAWILHLLNFNYKNSAVVDNIKIDMQIPGTKKVKEIVMETPDGQNEKLAFKDNGKRILFTVPRLKVYDIIIVKFL